MLRVLPVEERVEELGGAQADSVYLKGCTLV